MNRSPVSVNQTFSQTALTYNIFDEWNGFKALEKGLEHCELVNDVLSNSESFTVLEKLLSIVSMLPVFIVCCERGFIFLNLIKS